MQLDQAPGAGRHKRQVAAARCCVGLVDHATVRHDRDAEFLPLESVRNDSLDEIGEIGILPDVIALPRDFGQVTVRGGIPRHDEICVVDCAQDRRPDRRIRVWPEGLRHQYHFRAATPPATCCPRQLQCALDPPLIAVCEACRIDHYLDFTIQHQPVPPPEPGRNQRRSVTEFDTPAKQRGLGAKAQRREFRKRLRTIRRAGCHC